MKNAKKILYSLLLAGMIIAACPAAKAQATGNYKPDDKALFDTIVKMDSTFFGAYNNCDIKKQAAIYADSLEFYHDRNGLMTDKKALLEATEKNICGKVTRELVKGSIEVYPIKGFGAIEMGLHMFHNNAEKDAVPHPSKFIIIWRLKNNVWQITRVVSLH